MPFCGFDLFFVFLPWTTSFYWVRTEKPVYFFLNIHLYVYFILLYRALIIDNKASIQTIIHPSNARQVWCHHQFTTNFFFVILKGYYDDLQWNKWNSGKVFPSNSCVFIFHFFFVYGNFLIIKIIENMCFLSRKIKEAITNRNI